jgi:hypothetical protein
MVRYKYLLSGIISAAIGGYNAGFWLYRTE